VVQPDNWQIHQRLFELYFSMSYLDLARDHLAQAKPLKSPRGGPATKDELEAYEQRLEGFTKEVKKREGAYTQLTKGERDLLIRFRQALIDQVGEPPQPAPRGLVRLGLKLLLEARDADTAGLRNDPAQFHEFASWQLYLLLTTGQAREAAERLKEEKLRNVLPGGEYEELRATAAAALGDYPTADRFLDLAEKARQLAPDEQLLERQVKAERELATLRVRLAAACVPVGDG